MIAKISHGGGFGGLCRYLLREDQTSQAWLLGGTMSATTARGLAHEFGVFRLLNRRVRKPAFHASLRLPVGDMLSDARWRALARDYLMRMGYHDTAYIVMKHPERHVHIVASRVRFDGSPVLTWHERWTSLVAMAALERGYGLTQAPERPTPDTPARVVRLTREEERLAQRVGEIPVKVILARRIDRALLACDGTPEGFAQALAEAGVEVHWHVDDGRVRGAVYRLLAYVGPQQDTMAGRKIGPLYAWGEVEARLAGRAEAEMARQEPLRPRVREIQQGRDMLALNDREVCARVRHEMIAAEPSYERGGRD